jgi:hypothetical protein
MNLRFSTLAFLLSTLCGADAALPAFDSAADPAYDAGWVNGSNGGYGFDAWQITNNSDSSHFAGTFIGDAGASGVNPAIDTNGRAFGLYANTSGNVSGASVSAVRDFTGGPLLPGQSFSVQIADNYRDGAKGILFNGASVFGTTLGGLFIGGSPEHLDLTLNDTVTLSSVNYTSFDYHPDALYNLTITQIDASHLSAHLTLTTGAGTQDLVTLTANSPGDITGFNVYYGSTATYFPQNDIFFNNFAVTGPAVPEPSTVALISLGLLGALIVRRVGSSSKCGRDLPGAP